MLFSANPSTFIFSFSTNKPSSINVVPICFPFTLQPLPNDGYCTGRRRQSATVPNVDLNRSLNQNLAHLHDASSKEKDSGLLAFARSHLQVNLFLSLKFSAYFFYPYIYQEYLIPNECNRIKIHIYSHLTNQIKKSSQTNRKKTESPGTNNTTVAHHIHMLSIRKQIQERQTDEKQIQRLCAAFFFFLTYRNNATQFNIFPISDSRNRVHGYHWKFPQDGPLIPD